MVVWRILYFRKTTTQVNDKSSVKGVRLIASNHSHEIDPFILISFLPIRTFFRIFPFKFMTANVYYYRWWKPFLWLAGGFPASQKNRRQSSSKYGVGASRKFLSKGYSVIIFPEGKRTRSPLPARSGIKYILHNLSTEILLVKITEKNKSFRIIYSPATRKLNRDDPQEIIDAVYKLSNQD